MTANPHPRIGIAQRFIQPAVGLMNRLRLAQKFSLITLLFLLPLAFVMALLLGQIEANITRVDQELTGTAYWRAVRNLYQVALQNQIEAAQFQTGRINTDQMLRVRTEIDQALTTLARLDGQTQNNLSTRRALETLTNDWQKLKAASLDGTSSEQDLNVQLVANVRALMTQVGNSSNLYLDSQLDSHYLIDALLLKLPEAQNLQANTLALDLTAMAQQNSTAGLARTSTLMGLLQSNIDGVQSSMQAAQQSELTQSLQSAIDTTAKFISAVAQTWNAPAAGAPATDYWQAGSLSLQASFQLGDAGMAKLDQQLQARRAMLEQQRALAVGITVAVLLLVAYLWVGFYRAVMRTVLGMELASQRLTQGNMHGKLELDNHDELGQIVVSFNRIAIAVQESQQRLADIIDFMPDPVFVIDCDGKVMAWNRAIEQMTGITAKEMLGKGNYEYAIPFYGERRPILIDLVTLPENELDQQYAQLKREGSVLIGETYVPHLKGGSVFLSATASALYDSKGERVGAIEIVHDLTERKHMEEDLHQAKEAAEAATQAKSAFLATMSHEIRTPMNAVIGMTGLLLDTGLNPQQREFAETIRTSGDALLTIINDILDFSKIEAGRMDLESQPFVLRECIESAIDLLASKANEKGIDLACVINPEVPIAILGDVTRLRQIVVNLIGNALKFTEKGEVVVSITCDEKQVTGETSSEIASPATWHFTVRDTGIGIPPDRMNRLFRSFSQVDASTTRRYGGTGLGLAISKRLCELMGGTMWVESEGIPGKGSTFHFTIQGEATTPPTARAYMQGTQPHLEGKRVLIVDDNATNCRILTLQTQAWNMLPYATDSPIQALAWVKRGDPFDIAFLDWQMPEMDGITLATEIRRLREPSQMAIVMLSSLGQKEARFDNVELNAFLLKPIKASQLYNTLAGILGTEAALAIGETDQSQLDSEMGKRHPLSILLAEDNATNQKLALLVLERLGYRADVAANGIEVLQAVRRQPYDVVLMDVQMPEMDGLEATRTIIREFPVEKRPRIVAMTANAMKEDRDECFAAGMEDFVTKPIQFVDLVAALNRCRARTIAQMGEQPITASALTAETAPSIVSPASSEQTTPATSETALPVFDPAALARLRNTLGKQADAMLPTLIDNLYKDAPKLIREAQQKMAEQKPADVRRAAHTLKSTSATFGAMALSALARELENCAKAGTLDNAGELLTRIETEFDKARVALQAYRQEHLK